MLAVVAFAVALGFGVVAPAIPLFARHYGVGKTAIGLAISAFAFFRFVSALSAGGLVDRLGERRVLVAGLLTVAATTGTAPLAPHFALFVALRGIGGIGSAAFTVSATALVLRIAPQSVRGRSANAYQSGFLLGGVMGPAIGGPLTDLDARMPFFFYGGTLVVAAVVALLGLRRHDREPRRGSVDHPQVGDAAPQTSDWSALASALRHRAYLAMLVVNFGTGWTLFGVRNSLVPLYVVEDLGRTATFAGIGLLVGNAAQALGLLRSGWLADTVGRKPAVLLGSGLATLGLGLLALPPMIVGFLAAMTLLGLAASLLGAAPSAVVGDISPGHSGRLVAAFQMSGDIGAVIGPLVAGAMADSVGAPLAFGVTAGVLAVGFVTALGMPETRRPAMT